jgi:hypothetical protein
MAARYTEDAIVRLAEGEPTRLDSGESISDGIYAAGQPVPIIGNDDAIMRKRNGTWQTAIDIGMCERRRSQSEFPRSLCDFGDEGGVTTVREKFADFSPNS